MPYKNKSGCKHPGCAAIAVSHCRCEKHQTTNKPCAYAGCPESAADGDRYCSEHRRLLNQSHTRESNQIYNNKAWARLSKAFRVEHPLCQRCKEIGKLKSAVLVHHIVEVKQGGELMNPDNLMALCFDCHEKIHNRRNK